MLQGPPVTAAFLTVIPELGQSLLSKSFRNLWDFKLSFHNVTRKGDQFPVCNAHHDGRGCADILSLGFNGPKKVIVGAASQEAQV